MLLADFQVALMYSWVGAAALVAVWVVQSLKGEQVRSLQRVLLPWVLGASEVFVVGCLLFVADRSGDWVSLAGLLYVDGFILFSFCLFFALTVGELFLCGLWFCRGCFG